MTPSRPAVAVVAPATRTGTGTGALRPPRRRRRMPPVAPHHSPRRHMVSTTTDDCGSTTASADLSCYRSSSTFADVVSRPRAAAAATRRRARRRVNAPTTGGAANDGCSDRVSSGNSYRRRQAWAAVSMGASPAPRGSAPAVTAGGASPTVAAATLSPAQSGEPNSEVKVKGLLRDLSSAVGAMRQEVASLRWAVGFLSAGVGDGATQSNASAAAAAAMAASSAASAAEAWRVAGMAGAAAAPAVTHAPFSGVDSWSGPWGWGPASSSATALPPCAAASLELPSGGWMWAHHAVLDASVTTTAGVAGGVPSAERAAEPRAAPAAASGRHPATTGRELVGADHQLGEPGFAPGEWMPVATDWWSAVAGAAAGLSPDAYAAPPEDFAVPAAASVRPPFGYAMPVLEAPLSSYATMPVGSLR